MVHSNRFGMEADDASNGQRGPTSGRRAKPLFQVGGVPHMPFSFEREIHHLPEDRRQLIFRVRRQIAEGTYDTPAKFELAIERLLERLEGRDAASEKETT